MKFKPQPSAETPRLPSAQAVEAFAAGAGERRLGVQPWDGLDPKAKPTSGVNVRFNERELAVLRALAAADDRSLQRTIKRLLMAAAEAELQSRGMT